MANRMHRELKRADEAAADQFEDLAHQDEERLRRIARAGNHRPDWSREAKALRKQHLTEARAAQSA